MKAPTTASASGSTPPATPSSMASTNAGSSMKAIERVLNSNELSATKVYVRVRPFTQREREMSVSTSLPASPREGTGVVTEPHHTTTTTTTPPCTVLVDPHNPSAISTLDPSRNFAPKMTYLFEKCFCHAVRNAASLESTTLDAVAGEALAQLGEDQAAVYAEVGRPVLQNTLDGYNGCVFAYGQTGSGKTYTMMGPPACFAAIACELSETSAGLPCAERPPTRTATGLGTPPPAPRTTRLRRLNSTMSTPTDRSVGLAYGSKPTTPCVASELSVPLSARRGGQHQQQQVSSLSSTPRRAENSAATPYHWPTTMRREVEGIIPRLLRDLFAELRRKREKDSSYSFRVELAYYEIYNEKVLDLLAGGTASSGGGVERRVRHSANGPYIEHLTTKHVEDEQQVLAWMAMGNLERHTAATKMNERSSRSHAILSLHLVQIVLSEDDLSSKMSSKLNLVDLAGSERTGMSGVVGTQFKEAVKINLSLTTLGRVIDALADLSQGKRGVFCPYRDSILTWLLSDSLGGNSKTSMIATISPHVSNVEEATQTLRYASRAKQIVAKVIVNEDPQVRQIKLLTNEVERLNKLLAGEGMSDEYVDELRERNMTLQAELDAKDAEVAQMRAELDATHHALQQATDSAQATMTANIGRELSKVRVELQRMKDENARLSNERAQAVRDLRQREQELDQLRRAAAFVNTVTEGSNATNHSAHTPLVSLSDANIETSDASELRRLLRAARAANERLLEHNSQQLRESLRNSEQREWQQLEKIGKELIASSRRVSDSVVLQSVKTSWKSHDVEDSAAQERRHQLQIKAKDAELTELRKAAEAEKAELQQKLRELHEVQTRTTLELREARTMLRKEKDKQQATVSRLTQEMAQQVKLQRQQSMTVVHSGPKQGRHGAATPRADSTVTMHTSPQRLQRSCTTAVIPQHHSTTTTPQKKADNSQPSDTITPHAQIDYTAHYKEPLERCMGEEQRERRLISDTQNNTRVILLAQHTTLHKLSEACVALEQNTAEERCHVATLQAELATAQQRQAALEKDIAELEATRTALEERTGTLTEAMQAQQQAAEQAEAALKAQCTALTAQQQSGALEVLQWQEAALRRTNQLMQAREWEAQLWHFAQTTAATRDAECLALQRSVNSALNEASDTRREAQKHSAIAQLVQDETAARHALEAALHDAQQTAHRMTLHKLGEACVALEQNTAEERHHVATLQAELATAQQRQAALEKDIAELEATRTALEERTGTLTEAMQAQQQAAEQAEAALKAQCTALAAELQEVKGKNALLTAKSESLYDAAVCIWHKFNVAEQNTLVLDEWQSRVELQREEVAQCLTLYGKFYEAHSILVARHVSAQQSALQDALAVAQAHAIDENQRCQRLVSDLDVLQAQLKAEQDSSASLRSKVAEVELVLQSRVEYIAEVEGKLSSQVMEKRRLVGRLDEVQKELAGATQEVTRLREELSATRTAMQDARRKMDDELAALSKSLCVRKEQCERLKVELHGASERCAQQAVSVEELRGQLAHREDELRALRRQMQEEQQNWRQTLEVKEKEVSQLREDLEFNASIDLCEAEASQLMPDAAGSSTRYSTGDATEGERKKASLGNLITSFFLRRNHDRLARGGVAGDQTAGNALRRASVGSGSFAGMAMPRHGSLTGSFALRGDRTAATVVGGGGGSVSRNGSFALSRTSTNAAATAFNLALDDLQEPAMTLHDFLLTPSLREQQQVSAARQKQRAAHARLSHARLAHHSAVAHAPASQASTDENRRPIEPDVSTVESNTDNTVQQSVSPKPIPTLAESTTANVSQKTSPAGGPSLSPGQPVATQEC